MDNNRPCDLHTVGGRHLICVLSYVSLGRTERSCNSPTKGAWWSEGRSPFPLRFADLMENFPVIRTRLSVPSYAALFVLLSAVIDCDGGAQQQRKQEAENS